MSYLNRYIGTYRVIGNYYINTNDYPRQKDGVYDDTDLYIKCAHDCQIYHYGGKKLVFYCPSKGRGHNIIKAIEQAGYGDKIFEKEESDSEVLFKFLSNDIEILSEFLRPSTYGADILPHSIRNLPKTSYSIPQTDINDYKKAIADKPKIAIAHGTMDFIKSLATKKCPVATIKADMKQKGLRGKNYIHSIGKWKEFVEYMATV